MISLHQAHHHIAMLHSLQPVAVPLAQALGMVCAEDACAAVSCPTVDSSLKDGFAVVSTDIAGATPGSPVTLPVTGVLTAGDDHQGVSVAAGTAVRIMPGVRRLMGYTDYLPEKRHVLVTEELVGQEDWTQLVYGRVHYANGAVVVAPLRRMGRFEAMAAADVLIEIPEGSAVIRKDSLAEAWFFRQRQPSVATAPLHPLR